MKFTSLANFAALLIGAQALAVYGRDIGESRRKLDFQEQSGPLNWQIMLTIIFAPPLRLVLLGHPLPQRWSRHQRQGQWSDQLCVRRTQQLRLQVLSDGY